MATPIIMPKFGQMTEEASIVEWLKKEGDKISKGDVLFTVETDKSVMEMESFEEGTLLKIAVQPGVMVPVQSVVGYLGQPGEAIPTAAAPAPAATPAAPAAPEAGPTGGPAVAAADKPPAEAPAAAPGQASMPFKISPRAAAFARDHGVDPSKITGSGPGGRIVEKDVLAYLETRRKVETRGKEDEAPQPMSRMRQVIAQRLTQSFRDTPHFYVTVAVDMTDLIAYRNELKAAGKSYTVTDFIAQAVVLALKEFPDVNGSTDGKTVRRHPHVNLGIAVSLEQGLVVPVIPAAETLSLRELAERSRALAEKARAGKATPDELSGGTFTISNMGMMNVESFSAIINPGESAILAVASTVPQPVVRGTAIVVRQVMRITLSCDHRLVDGALGARFVNAVKQKLEDLALWKSLAA
ncbi:MAG: dihydrolipoamide acetyltransferase family protein [Opitutaceae bacterium]|nr:dihydrolipoamide acetyltransferase family protein [Opitutaceae bacterium]